MTVLGIPVNKYFPDFSDEIPKLYIWFFSLLFSQYDCGNGNAPIYVGKRHVWKKYQFNVINFGWHMKCLPRQHVNFGRNCPWPCHLFHIYWGKIFRLVIFSRNMCDVTNCSNGSYHSLSCLTRLSIGRPNLYYIIAKQHPFDLVQGDGSPDLMGYLPSSMRM